MIEYKKGNILDVQEGIIAHQVNCMGAMNSGLAKQIRAKYPEVYTRYQEVHVNPLYTGAGLDQLMGWVDFVNVGNNLNIANCYGQYRYGTNERQTHYPSLFKCVNTLCEYSKATNVSIHLPRIGCGLAGGDWAIVEQLLKIAHDTNGSPNITVWEL